MILVTGASGFVGKALVLNLAQNGIRVRALVRKKQELFRSKFIEQVVCENILFNENDWDSFLNGVDSIIHLIAKAHDLNDYSEEVISAYNQINVDITQILLTESLLRGVKKFIYLSSVKVNGESTEDGHLFGPDDLANPTTIYGLTKFKAENLIANLCTNTLTKFVIIRCPLVYGRDVKANFRNLIKLHHMNIPIPALGLNHNLRSFVGIDNLIDFIKVCLNSPLADNQTFMVSDNQDVSTLELIQKIGFAMNKKTKYFFVPKIILLPFIKLFIGKASANRLYSNLQVDVSKSILLLSWAPPHTLEENLKKIF